jgi:hypothetical protein
MGIISPNPSPKLSNQYPKRMVVQNLTNLIVFGVRLRSASKVAASGAHGPGASRSKRDDGLGPQWY